ncbi:MAG TPA: hypothetical protein VFF37_07750 [Streptomyces sp.]|uniref:hypothetical protein n=1 Tax=Streptomyces scabiei TaxID=1930 RepID=UPI0029B88518|nr:hypothetical protein [Streptomyces scabiei]MDX2800097.1 hypothetical protein [Streptomyces scabiei]HZX38205.1 hypothetical protein [Streptomyces sp.]
MSSTYRILCLSHDPALVEHGEYRTPEAAETAIHNGIPEHQSCDLMIGRYSAPLIELGCPRSSDQPKALRPGVLRCYHGGTVWTDTEWLVLLAAAYQSDDPAIQEAVKHGRGRHGCLPWDRLKRLRDELGITIKEQTDA